MQTILTVNEDI